MSEVQKQIAKNRADAAIQEMNRTLVRDDAQPSQGSASKVELPIYGESVKSVVQNLNDKAKP